MLLRGKCASIVGICSSFCIIIPVECRQQVTDVLHFIIIVMPVKIIVRLNEIYYFFAYIHTA
jgi:hypothetical protein